MIGGKALSSLSLLCTVLVSCSPKRNPEIVPVNDKGNLADSLTTIIPEEIATEPSFTIPFRIEEEYKKHDSAIALDPYLGHLIDEPNSSFKAVTAFSE